MSNPEERLLNPREQQIMNIVYEREAITASELEELLPGRPSNSTVRTLLRLLESRGQLKHVEVDGRFVYSATMPRAAAGKSALAHIVKTFFQGSLDQVFASLISTHDRVNHEDLDRLSKLIEEAKTQTQPVHSEGDGDNDKHSR
jgi:predicted transcriptional regulator